MSILYSSNIPKLYLIKIAKWFSLIMPIVVLFYNDNNLQQFHILLLQGIYSISIVLFEIPSGYLSDVLGRQKTLIYGSFMGFLGFAIYSFSHGFWSFLAAEIVLGIGASLISGADSALLYDSLLADNKSRKYLKYEGKMTSIGNFAEAIAGILGGILATYSLRYPYILQTAVAFMAFPAALSLKEPPREKVLQKLQIKDITQIFYFSLIENKELRYNILFSSLIGCSTLTMAWFVQPYFKEVELPLPLFGILWTLLNLCVGITSLFAYRFERRFNKRQTALVISTSIPLLYIILGSHQSIYGILFLFLFYLVRGIATPILKNFINQLTDSNIRATVLSIRNFVIRFIFAVVGPLLGWLTDHYSLKQALLLGGLIFMITGMSLARLLIKHSTKQQTKYT